MAPRPAAALGTRERRGTFSLTTGGALDTRAPPPLTRTNHWFGAQSTGHRSGQQTGFPNLPVRPEVRSPHRSWMMKIYVDYPLDPPTRGLLERVTAGNEVWIAGHHGCSDEDRGALLEAEAALGQVPRDLLPQTRRLRWLQLPSVGLDYYRGIDWEALGSRLTCTNLKGVFTEAVAQTTLAAILGMYRGLDELARLQVRRDWQKMAMRPRLRILRGASVLLLGAGNVATAMQHALKPFGCTFVRYARNSGELHTLADLDRALPAADIVIAALPDTPQTQGLLDRARIARFKPDALLVNIGRGSLIDEAALIEALGARRLFGAILDVTTREPLPPDDPLWSAPRLLLTQHTAAGSEREYAGVIELFGENLARLREGRPLLNVVDWKRGY